ncbi:hypothetical protein PVT68_13630 [Microbulbifer bruguierae]|uniref:Uncharacterized protein n=1 Tax=Microbulbifer bruguierae TaxID=3029061 RepID=A0ABY8NB49_9GAMM|nr:hypothetical protein [Microbulbifer bruguierae]WGL15807.1 hypothetical protein PVT68_13630 [Microbulbifer bruguierae]
MCFTGRFGGGAFGLDTFEQGASGVFAADQFRVVLAPLLGKFAAETCVVEAEWQDSFLGTAPERAAGCDDQPLVGFDPAQPNQWWAVLQQDAELALVARERLAQAL